MLHQPKAHTVMRPANMMRGGGATMQGNKYCAVTSIALRGEQVSSAPKSGQVAATVSNSEVRQYIMQPQSAATAVSCSNSCKLQQQFRRTLKRPSTLASALWRLCKHLKVQQQQHHRGKVLRCFQGSFQGSGSLGVSLALQVMAAEGQEVDAKGCGCGPDCSAPAAAPGPQ